MRFHDRHEAGQALAERLEPWRSERPLVFALPRGGVPVGAAVARALDAPLDVVIALKLGGPGLPELAAGAVAPGVTLIQRDIVRELEISERYLEIAAAELRAEVDERTQLFRGDVPYPNLVARTVILVDDGIATGATAAAAALSVRALGAGRVIVAAPVASREAAAGLDGADEVVVVLTPERFSAVSEWYEDFQPITDADALAMLREAKGPLGAARSR